MIQAALSIGSNLGERLANLQFAIDELAKSNCEIVAISSVYETEPVGGVEQDSFLNAALIVNTELDSIQLLELALEIEDSAARVRDVRWGPRTLDIDLIDVHGFTSSTEKLTIPHPRAHERAFVLVPLQEIDASWLLGGAHAVSALSRTVMDQKVIRRADLKLTGVQP